MHKEYKLFFMGFGNVGQALARLLLHKRTELKETFGITWRAVAISTGSHGAALDPEGIDMEDALLCLKEGKSLIELSTMPVPDYPLDFIRQSGADVLFENTPVDYKTGQPAIDHLRVALESGMHAITANKGPVVHAFAPLRTLAQKVSRGFFFESAVMDGAPVFGLWRETLPGTNLLSFRGVLNSTTNLILSQMEQGRTFDEAVRYAQSIGIAETDPSGDVDGWDAAVKVAALVTVLMGFPLKPDQVDREGIGAITRDDVAQAEGQGQRWKLLCQAKRTEDGVQANVHPELVDAGDPLYSVMGTSSAITFESDTLGLLTLRENDPGPHTTAYGLLADFLNAVRDPQ